MRYCVDCGAEWGRTWQKWVCCEECWARRQAVEQPREQLRLEVGR